MDENKLLNNMDSAEDNKDFDKEPVETEEVIETEEYGGETDDSEEQYYQGEGMPDSPEPEPSVETDFEVKKSNKGVIAVIAIIAVAVIAAIFLIVDMIAPKDYTMGDIYVENKKIIEKSAKQNDSKKEENTKKYNSLGYANVSGQTIGEWCEENGVDFARFVAQYNLPEDITEDTYFDVAQYMMPAWVMAEMYGTDFKTLKENFELPDTIKVNVTPKGFLGLVKSLFSKDEVVEMEIDENMPWGLVYDEVTLGVLVGEDLDSFKEEYGFGEEVTVDTKWKEIRHTLEKKAMEDKKKQEAEAEKEGTEFEGDEGVEEIPAEEEDQPEVPETVEAPEEAPEQSEATAE